VGPLSRLFCAFLLGGIALAPPARSVRRGEGVGLRRARPVRTPAPPKVAHEPTRRGTAPIRARFEQRSHASNRAKLALGD
jgi:hypothetical protein